MGEGRKEGRKGDGVALYERAVSQSVSQSSLWRVFFFFFPFEHAWLFEGCFGGGVVCVFVVCLGGGGGTSCFEYFFFQLDDSPPFFLFFLNFQRVAQDQMVVGSRSFLDNTNGFLTASTHRAR